MRSTILTISTAALLLAGAVSAQASTAAPQWDRRSPYSYEQRHDEFGERRAFQNGQRDGYSKGFDDARHHRRPDMDRQRWYRNGDHYYDRSYGSRDEYRVEYRRGFAVGYDRAFHEGREDWRR
jgi:hypothetical protein